jgi:hypothetical protein
LPGLDLRLRELRLPGAADEDEGAPCRAVGDERAAQLGTDAGGREQVAEAGASLRLSVGRGEQRRRLARGVGDLRELVDVVARVLVVGQDREAVGDVLEVVLGDQVRAGVERVPARAVERHGALQSKRGLVEELGAHGRAKREAPQVVEDALTLPRHSLQA